MSDDEPYFARTVTAADLREILMAARISPKAKPGSLLKGERKPGTKREKRPDYLALIRRCPCLFCDADPAGEVAHLRMAGTNKPVTGVGIKPDDCWTLPLCHTCHMRQHKTSEALFWFEYFGQDPFRIALELYAEQASIERMRTVIFAAREKRK